jgi:hypothetical protein
MFRFGTVHICEVHSTNHNAFEMVPEPLTSLNLESYYFLKRKGQGRSHTNFKVTTN